MQSLWSRVALSQSSCRCRICLHPANALIRRSTTATSRRKITVADVFTACYTTILGTATIIDARRKNERRQELDRELDRARASLHQLAAAAPQSPLDLGHGVPDGEASTLSQLVRDITSHTADGPARHLLEELQSLCSIAHRPAARPPSKLDQLDWYSIEAAVAAEEEDPETVVQEPRTSHHLAETTATVLGLVDELLRRTEMPADPRPQDQTDGSDPAGDSILKELEYLRKGYDFPCYQSPMVDPSYSTRVRAVLNESIRLIFKQAISLREAVGKICYNMLTAGVPPTIHTYNTLIVGFNQIQRRDLAEAVINSCLRQTSWPATDQTVVCLLAHYRHPGGREGMRDALKTFWGGRVNDLHLAPLDDGNLHDPGLLNSRHSQRGRGSLLKRIKDATFDHIIRGWLYHGEMGFACRSFMACLRNGSTIPIYTLQELFRSCLATADFANARKLLVGIIRNYENFQLCLANFITNNATAEVQELLRSLCQIIIFCWLPFGEIFGVTYQRYHSAATLFLLMIRRLDVQLEMKETARLPALLSNALSSDESLLTRLQLAISTLDRVDIIRQTDAIYDDCIRIARVISIDRRYRDLEERTQDLVAAYNGAIISIETGYDIHARFLLLSSPNTQTSQRKRLALRRALNQINVRDGSLTLEEIAWQLFRRIPNLELVHQLEQHGNWKRLSIPVLVSFYSDNAASPRVIKRKDKELNNLYEQLHDQIREARDSIRALIFTYLSQKSQSRSMSHYDSYYSIPLSRLRSHLHRELKYGLTLVLQGFPQYNRPNVARSTPEPLLESGVEKLIIQNSSIPFEVDGPTSDMRRDLVNSWGNTRRHQEYEDLSMLREEDPRSRPAELE